MLSGLVVAEAESCSVDIESHIPQVVVEMYNYAKALTLALSLPDCFAFLDNHPAVGATSSVGSSQEGTDGFFLSLS